MADPYIPVDSLHVDKAGQVVQVKSTSGSVVVCDVKLILPRKEFQKRYRPLDPGKELHGHV